MKRNKRGKFHEMGITRSFMDPLWLLLTTSAGGGVPWSHQGAWSVQDSLHETPHMTLVHGAFQSKDICQKSPDLILLIKLEISWDFPFIHPPVSCCYFSLNFSFCWSTYERSGWLWWVSWSLFSRDAIIVLSSPFWELAGSLPFTGEMWSENGCCVKMRFLQWGRLCWVMALALGKQCFSLLLLGIPAWTSLFPGDSWSCYLIYS